MGVDVFWKDGTGLELDRVCEGAGSFEAALNRVQNPPRTDCPIMLMIDVYGDTTVMLPQTDTLVLELQRIRAETEAPATRIHLGRVLSLARAAGSRLGSFLE